MSAVRVLAHVDGAPTVAPPNDDGYFAVTLPFVFLGSYRNIFVNTNGSIGLTYGSPEFLPNGTAPLSIGESLFPYWSDVDLRGDPLNLGALTYGTANQGTIFFATWEKVGYFFERWDKRATFQVLMSATGFEFNYDTVQFDHADADYAYPNNHPAVAGFWLPYNAGGWPTGVRTLLGSAAANASHTDDTLTDGQPNALISHSVKYDPVTDTFVYDTGIFGRYDFNFDLVDNQPPLRLFQRDDTIGLTGSAPRLGGNVSQGSSSLQYPTAPRLPQGGNTYQ